MAEFYQTFKKEIPCSSQSLPEEEEEINIFQLFLCSWNYPDNKTDKTITTIL